MKLDSRLHPVFVTAVFMAVCLLPAMALKDISPSNELRYLSIADEAIENGSVFTFSNQGEPYADKPPLYFWLLMGARLLLGEWRMWALALFSVLPAFGCVAVMNRWVRTATDRRGRWGASLMLLTSAMFIGSGIVLRMDMLMCLFILLALRAFYRMYTGEGGRWDGLLLPVWIFLAIFTKGPVGFIAPVLSIAVFLALRREWRKMGRYLGWRTWGILLGLCAVWFGCVYAEGGEEYLNNLLFHQTLDRASDSFHHKEPLWYYCMAYWYSLAPWSILYITVIIIALKKRLLRTDMERFFLTVIVTVFVVMSLFSAKLDIYLLPIFPFFPYLTAVLLPRMRGGWVAWTGDTQTLLNLALGNHDTGYGDALILLGREKDTSANIDCGYSGTANVDGTFTLVSYGEFDKSATNPYIMAVTFRLSDLGI